MRRGSRSISAFVVVLVGLLAAGPAVAQGSLRERIDAFVRAEQKRQGVVGLAVGVVQHGRVVLAKGYGSANLEHRVPVGTDTLFQSGSVGKMFTTMAVMAQVEAGRISLSDSITKYFPDAPASWAPITVRHLLNHTSGIQDLEGQLDERKDYTDEEFARFIYALPLDFPAGVRWSYSNSGYVLLGLLVNRVAGTPYGEVLATKVFKPAGMKTARGISEADVIPNRSSGYRLVGSEVKHQTWVSQSLNTTGDGSLYFSLKDMLAWDAAVQQRSLLSEESWREILSPARLNSGATQPYGFGWQLLERNGKPLHQHGGAWQGFRTVYSRFLGDSLSIIVLANTNRASPARFVEGIAAIVNPALAVPKLGPIEDGEPQVTAQLTELLEDVRMGTVDRTRFAYAPKWLVDEALPHFRELLERLGAAGPLVLAQREVVGDDRVYTYLVRFGADTHVYRVALIPDGRVTVLSVSERPN
ncbi:beta-lactamase family protein [Myxococcus llanfairpwllgwyngyllgogerychwyrndrobwllllantysiliogogogochensis]|uniref:Beta-lactamase family protein n=1 Tax=Myxococcus llanfairpwllgwyngyllgogerychwyrndrobwllllantysiliogogogochensis TaxID=2590453 RepID=A0A540WRK8_9BACT|nr:serine hydrolase domain-containing protein [Myxococcus llanfairpwllgwyngyllgogerychwyrndrobwllllantysiliogogogochensis]TQF11044.1 beta-lactamase family protein [Myxococcus llanfairpwllgwyngyllgogerychwyrndrobwllllantysiliogogogochensis]